MAYTAHEIAIADWLQSVLEPLGFSPVIFEDQGDVHPLPPYVTVRVLSDVAAGPVERRTQKIDALTAKHVYIDRREGTVSVSVIGGDFYQGALALHRSLYKQDTADANELAGLVVRGSLGGITIVGADSGGAVNNRAVIDFEFAYSSDETIEDDLIVLEATATGTINNG